MTQGPFEHEDNKSVLSYIREGMPVYDQDGKKIGTVERLHFGAENEGSEYGGGIVTESDEAVSGMSLTEAFARALDPADEIPETMLNRLYQHGFIRIDGAGLFAADRYVTPDQIAGVTDDAVLLAVGKEELARS